MRSPSDPAADEPIRNDAERFADSPLTPTAHPDEPFRNDVEHFDSRSPLSDIENEPIWHDAERFPFAPAGGCFRLASDIGDVYLPAEEPDVWDGVVPKPTSFAPGSRKSER